MEEQPRQKLCIKRFKLRTIKGIPFLIENNLIEYLEGTQTYKTTENGLKFLKMNNEIGELLHVTAKND